MCGLVFVCWCFTKTCVPAHLSTQSPAPEVQQDEASPALHPWGGWLTPAPAVAPWWRTCQAPTASPAAAQAVLSSTKSCTAIWTQGSGALWKIPTWIHGFKLRINIPKGHRDCGLDPSSFHSKFTWGLGSFRVTAPAVDSCGSTGRIDHLGYVCSIQ